MAIRKRSWVTAVVALMITGAVAWWFRPLPTAGPWQAQILDAENGRPLEGVIVLALWEKRTFAWPHPDRGYHDLDEVVSDKDGRVVIPARVVASRHPFQITLGPLLTLFKPGYGTWHFEGMPEAWREDPTTARHKSDASWYRFSHGGVVMVMPRAKTSQERKEIIRVVFPSPDVPSEKYPRFLAAYNQERVSLGFSR